ncbi:transcription factor grauzone-like [Stomoxys calcitrans]|uniref:C2H2-type domain-containing protein n=1 Tax=Stomoxys calcitrans TaxID=35570 RepID=A0A1I8PPH7_STOCA|nr:transcription factor grauzone-like [Stomoxys calcitrans]XP_013104915.1 transcription factor grauzone-like [Stomoxys calcitrans]
MAGSNVCRLCRSSCNDSIRLRDSSGRCNGVYNITKKYFNPKYLDVERGCSTPNAVLCMECWRHISGFNSFQQTILLLLDNLHNDGGQPEEENLTSQEFINANSLKVEEPSDVITIADDADENEPSSFEVNSVAGFGAGQLVVTDCAVQFSTDVGNIEQNAAGSNGIEYPDEVDPQTREPYDIDDDFEAAGGDVFIVDEFDNWEPEAADSVSSTDDGNGELVELRTRSESPGNSSPFTSWKDVKKKTNSEIDATIAQWKPLLTCYVCSAQFSQFCDVRTHFNQKHPQKEFYISCCGRKIKYRFRVEEHAIYHLNPQAYQCSLCGRCFSAKSTLEAHEHFQHSIKKKDSASSYTAKCTVCPKTFTYRTGVYHHMKAYHPEEFAKRKTRKRN